MTQRADTFLRLQPAFDALALLFLQPESDAGTEALRAAANCVKVVATGSLTPEEMTRLVAAAAREVTPLELAQAYAKLFLGVGEKTIPLCESAWTSPKHLLCQAAQIDCRRAYEAAGLELAGGSVVPEDHIGLMLAFLSVTALRNEAEVGLAFLSNHVATVAECIVRTVREAKEGAGPYADIVEVLEAILTLLQK